MQSNEQPPSLASIAPALQRILPKRGTVEEKDGDVERNVERFFGTFERIFKKRIFVENAEIEFGNLERTSAENEKVLSDFADYLLKSHDIRLENTTKKAGMLLQTSAIGIPALGVFAVYCFKNNPNWLDAVLLFLMLMFAILAVLGCVRVFRIERWESMFPHCAIDPNSLNDVPQVKIQEWWITRWKLDCYVRNELILNELVDFLAFAYSNTIAFFLCFCILILELIIRWTIL